MSVSCDLKKKESAKKVANGKAREKEYIFRGEDSEETDLLVSRKPFLFVQTHLFFRSRTFYSILSGQP